MIQLVQVTHGVWRPAEMIADLVGRLSAILTVCPAGTVVSGLTAARLHGFWLPDLPDVSVEVIVHPEQPVGARRPAGARRVVRARRQVLRPDEVMSVGGMLVTTPARTWLDLADRLQLYDLVAAGDCALRLEAELGEMEMLVQRAGHRRGVVAARAALPLLDGRSRSRPESHLRCVLVTAGLPAPAVNQPIYDEFGGWLAEPDLSYDDARVALEYNGSDHAAVLRMRRDMTRGIDVDHRGGWRVVAFGPNEVFRWPDATAAYVARLRAERLGQLPAIEWRVNR